MTRDISEIMDDAEGHIIDAIDGIDEILTLAEPQTPNARQSMAELDYFHETVTKAYDRCKSSIQHIING